MFEVLRVENLRKSFGGAEIFRNISFTVNSGETLVVMGPSGCGKSTMLRCINGLESVQSGAIHFNGNDLASSKTDWTRVRQKIGMVFQSYDLFPHMTVIENLILAPRKVQHLPKTECVPRADELLKRVGLSDKRGSYPRELSGGQKQRAAIVRALMMKPEIMLLDEITAALDPEMVHEVLDVVLELARDGVTMIIVTHEMRFAQAAADRVMFIDEGEIAEISPPEIFFQNPVTERACRFLQQFEYSKKKYSKK